MTKICKLRSVAIDVGTKVIHAIIFIMLLCCMAMHGSSSLCQYKLCILRQCWITLTSPYCETPDVLECVRYSMHFAFMTIEQDKQ